jgi:hypothetical protein
MLRGWICYLWEVMPPIFLLLKNVLIFYSVLSNDAKDNLIHIKTNFLETEHIVSGDLHYFVFISEL